MRPSTGQLWLGRAGGRARADYICERFTACLLGCRHIRHPTGATLEDVLVMVAGLFGDQPGEFHLMATRRADRRLVSRCELSMHSRSVVQSAPGWL